MPTTTASRLLALSPPILIGVVALLLAAPPALAAPGAPGPVASDSTEADPLDWARRVVQTRRAVEAAEQEADPDRRAVLSEAAFRQARALVGDESVRDLVLRAQAVYEEHHGAAHVLPLRPRELAELRGDTFASLLRPEGLPLRDPAEVAAERAARAEAARLAAAEAARADGPSWLFYPAEAAPLVAEQRAVARRFVGLRRQMRRLFPSVERTLRRRGLPTDLKYVAVIESSLNPKAESWAGARGLWQFMPATAAEYGLDSLSVEDPAASTAAAARYLHRLTRMFRGDHQLALAAYNSGPGRVQRLVRAHRAETGEYPTFWDLHASLPRETQAYVPRFIALAELMGG